MTIEDFERLAHAYGARIDLWPADRRAAALAFAASNARAMTVLAEAQALDALMAQAPTLPAGLALQTRIAADARRRSSTTRRRWLSALGAAMALAGACAAGAVTGVAAATREAEPARRSAAMDPADDAARFLTEPADPAAG